MTLASRPPICTNPACSKAGKRHYPPCNRARNPLAAFVASGLVEVPCGVCTLPIVKDDLYTLHPERWAHLRCEPWSPEPLLTLLKATAETQWPKPVTYPLPDGESSLTVRWSPPLRKGKPHRASIAVPSLCYVWTWENSGSKGPQRVEGDSNMIILLSRADGIAHLKELREEWDADPANDIFARVAKAGEVRDAFLREFGGN